MTWKHVKDLVRSIIGGEPKRADIPLLNVRPRRALVEILGEEDALKARSKLLHVSRFWPGIITTDQMSCVIFPGTDFLLGHFYTNLPLGKGLLNQERAPRNKHCQVKPPQVFFHLAPQVLPMIQVSSLGMQLWEGTTKALCLSILFRARTKGPSLGLRIT